MELKLTDALSPTRLEIINDSEKHRGHAGYDGSGESHFTVIVESATFTGKTRVAMQRMVMEVLKEELAGPVHALSIQAKARVPNAATLEAMKEAETGGGERFESAEALFSSWEDN